MNNLSLTILLIESLSALVILGILVWVIYVTTKNFGLKGFLRISSAIILPILIGIATEKFFDNNYEDSPILIMIVLGICAIFLIWVIINTIMTNLNSGEENKRKFIRDLIRDLKTLGLALLGGVVIVGLIVLSVLS